MAYTYKYIEAPRACIFPGSVERMSAVGLAGVVSQQQQTTPNNEHARNHTYQCVLHEPQSERQTLLMLISPNPMSRFQTSSNSIYKISFHRKQSIMRVTFKTISFDCLKSHWKRSPFKKTLWNKSGKLSQDTPVLPQVVKLGHAPNKIQVWKTTKGTNSKIKQARVMIPVHCTSPLWDLSTHEIS